MHGHADRSACAHEPRARILEQRNRDHQPVASQKMHSSSFVFAIKLNGLEYLCIDQVTVSGDSASYSVHNSLGSDVSHAAI
jgi:hypothetical protein